jgi:hypothetical protein
MNSLWKNKIHGNPHEEAYPHEGEAADIIHVEICLTRIKNNKTITETIK